MSKYVPSDPTPWGCFPIGPWHRWFAWYPVDTVTHGWRWLRVVERRRCQSKVTLPGPIMQVWQYRLPKKYRLPKETQ